MEASSGNNDVKSWERGYYDKEAEQKTESAHTAFQAYLALPQRDRSLDKAYQGTKRIPKVIRRDHKGTAPAGTLV